MTLCVQVGAVIWNDRTYTFQDPLPELLIGGVYIKGPYKAIPQGTVINVTVSQSATLYVAFEAQSTGGRSGGFGFSLPGE